MGKKSQSKKPISQENGANGSIRIGGKQKADAYQMQLVHDRYRKRRGL